MELLFIFTSCLFCFHAVGALFSMICVAAAIIYRTAEIATRNALRSVVLHTYTTTIISVIGHCRSVDTGAFERTPKS